MRTNSTLSTRHAGDSNSDSDFCSDDDTISLSRVSSRGDGPQDPPASKFASPSGLQGGGVSSKGRKVAAPTKIPDWKFIDLPPAEPTCFTPFETCGSVVTDTDAIRDALRLRNWQFMDTVGDGNCWFRAMSQALYNHEECHVVLRQEVAAEAERKFRESNSPWDASILGMSGEEALASIRKAGSFAEGEAPLLLSANLIGIAIHVWQYRELTQSRFERNERHHSRDRGRGTQQKHRYKRGPMPIFNRDSVDTRLVARCAVIHCNAW